MSSTDAIADVTDEPIVQGTLAIAGACNAVAALLHIGCILFGGPWYRFFGAGEHMARLAEAGHVMPTLVTLAIVLVLSGWAVVAWSGAGLLPRLPLLRTALSLIAGIYLLRGLVGLYWVAEPVMGNSPMFWLWSSLLCLSLGGLHGVGLWQLSRARGPAPA